MRPDYDFPSDLPPVQRSGRSARTVNPKSTQPLASGRHRERRLFTAVPVFQEVEWKLTTEQAAKFEKWFRITLKDGTEWFTMRLHLPQGDGPHIFRFSGIYTGPDLIGPRVDGVWIVTATLEQWLRAE